MPTITLKTQNLLVKKLCSYILPIKLQEFSSVNHHNICIYLQNGQFQLTYNNAIYSFGNKYKPFTEVFSQIEPTLLASKEKVLILGAGLGSIPQILQEQYKAQTRHFTIVDTDQQILELCEQLLIHLGIDGASYHIMDAAKFVATTNDKFDLICVDVFTDIEVPAACTTLAFCKHLERILHPNGILVFNYIPPLNADSKTLEANLKKCFNNLTRHQYRRNLLYYSSKQPNA